ncbi:MAG TPA: SPOR domain-containing protein, partial [Sphingopyxis sp.]|nr:SPOR domain-containing protein [Sphingopyxis sp.]
PADRNAARAAGAGAEEAAAPEAAARAPPPVRSVPQPIPAADVPPSTPPTEPGTSYAPPPESGALPPAAPPKPTPAPVAPPKPQPAPVQAAARAADNWRAQLGAFSQEGNARNLWAALERRYPALSANQPYLVKAGNLTRLQAGNFASKADADKFCATVGSASQPCVVMRSR